MVLSSCIQAFHCKRCCPVCRCLRRLAFDHLKRELGQPRCDKSDVTLTLHQVWQAQEPWHDLRHLRQTWDYREGKRLCNQSVRNNALRQAFNHIPMISVISYDRIWSSTRKLAGRRTASNGWSHARTWALAVVVATLSVTMLPATEDDCDVALGAVAMEGKDGPIVTKWCQMTSKWPRIIIHLMPISVAYLPYCIFCAYNQTWCSIVDASNTLPRSFDSRMTVDTRKAPRSR